LRVGWWRAMAVFHPSFYCLRTVYAADCLVSHWCGLF
jgi:hypothetical protein